MPRSTRTGLRGRAIRRHEQGRCLRTQIHRRTPGARVQVVARSPCHRGLDNTEVSCKPPTWPGACQLHLVVSPPFRGWFLRRGVDLRLGRGTAAMTPRRKVFTDSDVWNTSATSGARTTATVSFSRAAYGFGFALDQSSWYSAGMSTSLVRLRDLRVLFIFATLARRGVSGADDPDSVVRLREDYQKEVPFCRMPDDERALLLLAMGGVRQHLGQRISKDGRGILERHAVLPEVGRRFVRI